MTTKDVPNVWQFIFLPFPSKLLALSHLLRHHYCLDGLEHVKMVGKDKELGAGLAQALHVLADTLNLGLARLSVQLLHQAVRVGTRGFGIVIQRPQLLKLGVDALGLMWRGRDV